MITQKLTLSNTWKQNKKTEQISANWPFRDRAQVVILCGELEIVFITAIPFSPSLRNRLVFSNEKGARAEMRPAIVSGIVFGDAPVSY